MFLSDKWKDYRIVDASGGEKLEYWGKYLLRRPDPIAVWDDKHDIQKWNRVDAWYHRSTKGGGSWQVFNKQIPDEWQICYRELVFNVRPTGFKHTGLFPEQAVNWDWISGLITEAKRPIKTSGAILVKSFLRIFNLKSISNYYPSCLNWRTLIH